MSEKPKNISSSINSNNISSSESSSLLREIAEGGVNQWRDREKEVRIRRLHQSLGVNQEQYALAARLLVK